MLFLITEFLQDKCQQKASSLTYTTLLAIIPFMTVVIVIISSIPALESSRQEVYQLIYSYVLPESGVQISEYIDTFSQKSTNLTAVGILGLFFTSIMMLMTIERAFNDIWQVTKQKNWVQSIMRYWVLLTLGPLILSIIFAASTTVKGIQFFNQQVFGIAIDWAIWMQILSYGMTAVGFIGMYTFIPRVAVPIKSAVFTGIIISILFEYLKYSFGVLIANFTSYEVIYGAFAALPVFLVWIYLSWSLILLGVEISFCLTVFSDKKKQSKDELFVIIDLLKILFLAQKYGKTVHQRELRRVLPLDKTQKFTRYMAELMDKGLVVQTTDNNFVLQRSIDNLSVWDLYQLLPYDLPTKHSKDLPMTENSYHQIVLHELIADVIKESQQKLDITLSQLFSKS